MVFCNDKRTVQFKTINETCKLTEKAAKWELRNCPMRLKIKRADVVIDNKWPKNETQKQVRYWLKKINLIEQV